MSKTDGRGALLLLWTFTACVMEGPGAEMDDVLPEPVVMDGDQLEEYARLAPVTEPVALSDAELEHVLALRRQYGLSTDQERVRALHDAPAEFAATRSQTFLFGGLLLEEWEIPSALERAEVEYRGPDADLWAQRELGERYAGSYLEGTRLILACADCDRAQVARALADRRDLPEVLRGRVEIRTVEHSFAALQAMEARLAAYLGEHAIASSGTTVDIVDNALDLYAGPSTIAALERELSTLEEVAGGPVELVESDIDPEDHIYKHEALPYALVEGGQYIHNEVGNACTSGFAVQGYYGPFMLTAGHCAGINQTWYQGGSPLGRVALIEHSGRLDVAAISTWGTRNNWGRLHLNLWADRQPVTFAVSSHYLVGQTVCNTGWASTGLSGRDGWYTQCGVVSSQTYRPDFGEPVWGLASYASAYGDSGAGVYWPTGYGNGAAGIVKGVAVLGPGDVRSVFSRMPVILGAWGMSLSPN